MNEKPILFSTEMVKAILEGRKTQTRRVVKHAKLTKSGLWRYITKKLDFVFKLKTSPKDLINPKIFEHCPYGQVGDRLWVRETWYDTGQGYAVYKADCPIVWDTFNITREKDIKWKPSIFMPKEYSRIKLEITDIIVERVQDITWNDSKAEGIETSHDGTYIWSKNYLYPKWKKDWANFKYLSGCIQSFRSLWDSINKKRGYGWEQNPYVWVVEFKVVKK